MTRDKTHMEQIELWAEFVRTHPREEWIKQLKPFIDSQIIKANDFLKELSKTEEGRKKIVEIKKL